MTKTKIWAGVSLFFFFALVVSVVTSALVIRSLNSLAPAAVISSTLSSSTPTGTNSASAPAGRQVPATTKVPSNPSSPVAVKVVPVSTVPPVTPPAATKPAVTLSATLVAKHSTAGDCWTIISGQVYNLTSFADLHSGGPQAIAGTCGVDSTTAFFNRHSTRELNILARYLIGSVGQTISAAPAGPATQTTSPARAPGGFNRDDDD